ncbi:MAG: hypothetical protein ACOH17_12685 [Cellulomonas sp.]
MSDDNVTWHADEPPLEHTRGVLLWLGSMVFLLLGFFLMGTAADQDSGVLFILGVVSCATALMLPMAARS